MQELCRALSNSLPSVADELKSIRAVSIRKVAALIRSRQCNSAMFRDVLANLQAVKRFIGSEAESPLAVTALVWPLVQYHFQCSGGPSKEEFPTKLQTVIDQIEGATR